ncbi:MAG: ribosome silencing factor [Hydrotalea sp.]|nr:ribosome silencing factor [Hydrotalea sp.]
MPFPATAGSTNQTPPAVPTKVVLQSCLTFLSDNKAEDIITINVEQKFPLADYMVIVTGTSARHVVSLAQNLSDKIRLEHGVKTLSLTGEAQGEWLLLDLGDIIIHLFQPTAREYYQLEKRWADN